jgi:hypothetical protein
MAFEPGSFYDNLDVTVKALGMNQPGVVWALAGVSWDSLSDRDAFLATLTGRPIDEVVGGGGA